MVNSYDGKQVKDWKKKKQFLKTSYSAPLVRGHGARLVGDKTFKKDTFKSTMVQNKGTMVQNKGALAHPVTFV